MNIKIVINEDELKELIINEIDSIFGIVGLSKDDIRIEVKQNYKSEWETAEFRAIYEK